ncbi:hypothetical protein Tco_1151756 [Tanacetum coccineum]
MIIVVKNIAVVMVVVENIVVEYFLDSQNFGSRKKDTVVMVIVVDDTPIVIDKLVRVTFAFQKEDTVARKNLSFVNLGSRKGGGDFLEEGATGNSNIKQCLRKVADGHFTAAVKVLSSSGIAPYCDDTIKALEAKHPYKPPPSMPSIIHFMSLPL